ncbi:glycosyltransferase family 4 protein [Mucilaginibacter sp. RS28]|uniref:Glycosyltransferase family 4 protein n=1 Tax=Mucilaginibacter straminoryzae TaxID=2932774 RepID=A0A9X2BDC7_9SPHI|nr:glycosyltransferase family 1 protein [Mucilaginibacter straminoryzae]MCJ8210213.1 glycosyltransferase family 4 protein [Mucilaginibacter straminoryzae]
MNIGFDAKRAFLNRTGLGNYSRWLIHSLVEYFPDNDYFLYTPKQSKAITFPAETRINVITRLPNASLFKPAWRTRYILSDLKRDRIDLYHGLSHELPFGIKKSGIKSVVTIHDLIVLKYPQYFKAVDRLIYKAKLKYACKAANAIVAMSEQTKGDLNELLNVPLDKISVIYQGCDEAFKKRPDDARLNEVRLKYQLPDQYLLNVGTIETRKNLQLLIEALPFIPEIKLVVVGKPTGYLELIKKQIRELNLTDRILFLHQVPFEDLPAIYHLAKCFIYPSRYEGFGIPILEALSSGVPVVAATGSCLEEAGGPDSLYVNPDDHRALAVAVNRILADEKLANSMISRGLSFSANFAPDLLAKQYISLYQQITRHA